MHETLKILISTLIVIVITSLVFFALYFLSPSVSEELFGISYQSSKENPIETFSSSFLENEDEVKIVEEEESTVEPDEALTLSESGREVKDFFLGLSDQAKAELSSRVGDISAMLESDDGVPALNSIGEYLEDNNLNIKEVFNTRDFFNFMHDNGSDAIEHVVAFLGGAS